VGTQVALFIAGFGTPLLVIADYWNERDADSLLLRLAVLGHIRRVSNRERKHSSDRVMPRPRMQVYSLAGRDRFVKRGEKAPYGGGSPMVSAPRASPKT
jgi:hypothetical protein